MAKAIGTEVFVPDLAACTAVPAYVRASAKDLGLKESWYRDAIFANPELVIAPCREAGLLLEAEEWFGWTMELTVGDVGRVDVLLVSSLGRIGIVETKLSYNPERRREVVAQVLDYALALSEDSSCLPALPKVPGAPTDIDLRERVGNGEFLLIIAGDASDPRALRLAEGLLARHLTSEWDLAMIDLNLYADKGRGSPSYLLIPEIRGTLVHETRQVVRVTVKGETPEATIKVVRLPSGSNALWTEERLFARAKEVGTAAFAKGLENLLAIAKQAGTNTRIDWGAGANLGGFALRTGNNTLFYARTDGLQIYVGKLTTVLGADVATPLFEELGVALATRVPTDQPVPKLDPALLADAANLERFKTWVEKLRQLLRRQVAQRRCDKLRRSPAVPSALLLSYPHARGARTTDMTDTASPFHAWVARLADMSADSARDAHRARPERARRPRAAPRACPARAGRARRHALHHAGYGRRGRGAWHGAGGAAAPRGAPRGPARRGMTFEYFDAGVVASTPGWEHAFASTLDALESAGLAPDDSADGRSARLRDIAALWRALDADAGASITAARALRDAAAALEADSSAWPFDGPTFVAIVTDESGAALARFACGRSRLRSS